MAGSKRLTPLEAKCLASWRSSLSTQNISILDTQLDGSYFVQRQAGGAKLCFFFFNKDGIPAFHDESSDLLAGTVSLGVHGGSKAQIMRVKIFIQRGYLFSIEFPKRPKQFLQRHNMLGQPLEIQEVISNLDS